MRILPFTPAAPENVYELPPLGTIGLWIFAGIVGWALVICWARFAFFLVWG